MKTLGLFTPERQGEPHFYAREFKSLVQDAVKVGCFLFWGHDWGHDLFAIPSNPFSL